MRKLTLVSHVTMTRSFLRVESEQKKVGHGPDIAS